MIGLGTMSMNTYANTYSPMQYSGGSNTAAKPDSTRTDTVKVKAYQDPIDSKIKKSDQNTDRDVKKKDSDRSLDHVVATSDFGDTLQVSEEGQARYDQYDQTALLPPMFRKTEAEQAAVSMEADTETEAKAVETAEESEPAVIPEEKTASAPTSYAGISDSQMRELYLKGVISRYDYDSVIEQRKEVRESEDERKDQLDQQLDTAIQRTDKVDRESEAIRIAFGDDSTPVPDAGTRLDMMDKASKTAEDKNAEQEKASKQDKIFAEHKRYKIVVG